MNPAREFHRLVTNFCAGVEILQSYNADRHGRIMVEDGDLVWAKTEQLVLENDHAELQRLGWEYQFVGGTDGDGRPCEPFDGLEWTFRMMIPTAPCADRLKSEAEVAELHAMY